MKKKNYIIIEVLFQRLKCSSPEKRIVNAPKQSRLWTENLFMFFIFSQPGAVSFAKPMHLNFIVI